MEPGDAKLVARVVASRDERAFEQLVLRHQTRLRNWLRQMTGDQDAADDIVQDTFIRGWHRIRELRQPDRFSSWLMSIAYRTFLQHERARGSADRRHAMSARPEAFDDPAGRIDASVDLDRVLATLGTEQRAAMVLCYAHGMSHGEIAEVLNLPLGTVKSHIRRGKIKIQMAFGEPASA